MAIGFLGAASESKSYNYTTTTTNVDSGNRSASSNSVLDNVGNLTLEIGGQASVVDRWLPIIALGFLLLAFTKGGS